MNTRKRRVYSDDSSRGDQLSGGTFHRIWGVWPWLFVYTIGASVDNLFYAERLPTPTFGTPGLLWSALTLAVLTLPVVIVATEEGLSRIPISVRHGSLALGATQFETIWRIVLPMASPAIITGLILAIARAKPVKWLR